MSDGMGRELAYLSSHATNRYFIPNWGKNYKNFWIEYVNESVGDKTIKNVPSYDDKPYSEVKGSYTSSKVEGNTLTVTFAPNETQDGRYVRVAVSEGDIFDKIMFVQKLE